MLEEKLDLETKNSIGLAKITGDPFIDSGSLALEYIASTFPQKTIKELIEFASEIFVEKWKGKINAIQLNSNITHITKTGSKTNREKAKTAILEYFQKMDKPAENKSKEGYCRTCGKKGSIFKAGREQFCLAGSGSLVNFHHLHESGLTICNSCSLKLFFLPLAVMQLGGKLGLLHTQDKILKKYWSQKTIQGNLFALGRSNSDGIIKSEYKNAKNAIFKIAEEIISQYEITNQVLQLFHFTNFGASPDCEIYLIPNKVFVFIKKVMRSCPKDWLLFTKRHYKIRGSIWDHDSSEWSSKNELLSENEYKDNNNIIFEKLLMDRSILNIIFNFYRELYFEEKPINSLLAIYYVKEVRNMQKEQIELIKRLGNEIFKIATKESNIKKYLSKIEGASKAYQLRSVLLYLIKKNYLNGENKPIVSLQEYVDYLFPDGQFWGEVRDLLLIFIYEKLHEENIKRDEIEDITFVEAKEELFKI